MVVLTKRTPSTINLNVLSEGISVILFTKLFNLKNAGIIIYFRMGTSRSLDGKYILERRR